MVASASYSRNFGLKLVECADGGWIEAMRGTIVVCDVARVDFMGLRDEVIDVVVEGSPCQDFSIVMRPVRRRIEVNRDRLYARFIRAPAVLQQKAFVFGNVPELLTANSGMAYRVILEDFKNLKIRWTEVKL